MSLFDDVSPEPGPSRTASTEAVPPGAGRGDARPELHLGEESVFYDSFTTVFSHALRGNPCVVTGLAEVPELLPISEWTRVADDSDLALLGLCTGSTLDIGCGPGRLTAALAELGHLVLGIDVVREAVGQTRGRGVTALHRDVFDRLPGEGKWHTALLADGNVGIGGDPVALLARVGQLIQADGRVVVEVAAPGVQRRTVSATLESGGLRSRPFRWSVLGADDAAAVAAEAGFTACVLHDLGDRWCAVLSS